MQRHLSLNLFGSNEHKNAVLSWEWPFNATTNFLVLSVSPSVVCAMDFPAFGRTSKMGALKLLELQFERFEVDLVSSIVTEMEKSFWCNAIWSNGSCQFVTRV